MILIINQLIFLIELVTHIEIKPKILQIVILITNQ
jgi:hypothetical protein